MKKLVLFLSTITCLLLIFVHPLTVKADMRPECQYQFDLEDIEGTCWCVWNGIEHSTCGCPGC